MLPDLKTLLEALTQEKVNFVIIGGIASISHGMDYTTNDIDLCYQRSELNHRALIKALSKANPKLRTQEGEGVPFLFDEKTITQCLQLTLQTDWGPIDLLGEVPGLGKYEDFFANSKEVVLYGFSVKILGLEDLIKAKKTANRSKDQLHLLELETILEIKRKSNS